MDGRRRIAVLLGLCAAAAFAGSLIGGSAGTWLFALASLLFPALLLALSFEPTERRRLRWMLVGLTLLFEGSAVGLLLASGRGAARILGLPPATLIMILGFGVLPFLLIVVAYARSAETADDSGNRT
jgi:hypothetical protein